jgi:hypothetical protein
MTVPKPPATSIQNWLRVSGRITGTFGSVGFLWKSHHIYNFPIDKANSRPSQGESNQRNRTSSQAPIERSG